MVLFTAHKLESRDMRCGQPQVRCPRGIVVTVCGLPVPGWDHFEQYPSAPSKSPSTPISPRIHTSSALSFDLSSMTLSDRE
jgi:hypothetical protein